MNDIAGGAHQSATEAERIVIEEVGRLLESAMFMRSPVLSRLLQFLADHGRQGGRAAPKAYAIATEALGRSADFDPAVDSYPRVMVGRLRSLLDRYYAETPSRHRLRVPQGSYEIMVEYRADPSAPSGDPVDASAAGHDASGLALSPAPARPQTAISRGTPIVEPMPPQPQPMGAALRAIRWRWAGFALAILLALAAGWWIARSQYAPSGGAFVGMPIIEVSDPAAGETGPSRAMARALDGKLRDGLRRFDLVQLLSSHPSRATLSERGSPDYRLDTSLVRALEGGVDVTLVLNRVRDQRAIWSQQIRLTADEVPEFGGIEPAIAQMAGDYGVIVRDQLQREPDNYAAGFPCLAQYNRVLHNLNRAAVPRIDSCLRASFAAMPHDPVPLSALSLLRFSDWQAARATPRGKIAFADGQNLAEQAYEIDSNRSASLFAMARAKFYSGDCQRGTSLGDAAIALNPYDPEISGFLGLFKTTCGRTEAGEILLRRSLTLDPSHPGVPAVVLAFLMSQRGENAEAMALLDSMPSPSNMEPQYLMTRSLVLARTGEKDEARRLWLRLHKFTGQPDNAKPEAILGQFMVSPFVVMRTAKALREAGVVG